MGICFSLGKVMLPSKKNAFHDTALQVASSTAGSRKKLYCSCVLVCLIKHDVLHTKHCIVPKRLFGVVVTAFSRH